MNDIQAKAYGGPSHGQFFNTTHRRITVASEPMLPPIRMWNVLGNQLDYSRLAITENTYYREKYRRTEINPQREKQLFVFILEGAKLTSHERINLNQDFHVVPWAVKRSSMFDNFEQWFSATVHRLTGELWWHDEHLPK